ncbi:hypothetical protein CPB83DRAFT_861535 [Crepidotus variabilis]|uniref:Uncharacterized protein n=1 Tax=Crepidotus variabilis TaxID=179855 RepID=A0A9P6JKJ7_9AGAR|nr:hypothetical protein CPB83DRAFT_861535 [Crepidotus variabilis]
MSHSVTLPHPIAVVFPILSEPQHMESLQRLTPEAQQFSLLPTDQIRLPKGGLAPLFSPTHPKTAAGLPRPRTIDALLTEEPGAEAGEIVERVKFEFSGTVPLLFGLVKRPLAVAGAQVVEKNSRTVLFESGVEASGIRELKVRTFEEVILDGGKEGTKVKETVWGTCPFYLAPVLRIIAPGVHSEHMELYDKLFE